MAVRIGIINLSKRITNLRKELRPLEDAQVDLWLKKKKYQTKILGIKKIPIGKSGRAPKIELDPVALWGLIPPEYRKKLLREME